MITWFSRLYRYKNPIYKILLFLVSTWLLVNLFSKKQNFKCELKKKQVWNHTDLTPFDFASLKPREEYNKEVKLAIDNIFFF